MLWSNIMQDRRSCSFKPGLTNGGISWPAPPVNQSATILKNLTTLHAPCLSFSSHPSTLLLFPSPSSSSQPPLNSSLFSGAVASIFIPPFPREESWRWRRREICSRSPWQHYQKSPSQTDMHSHAWLFCCFSRSHCLNIISPYLSPYVSSCSKVYSKYFGGWWHFLPYLHTSITGEFSRMLPSPMAC